MKIRFYVNTTKPVARAAKKTLMREAKDKGLTVTTGKADIIIALGGDGTILRVVHEFPDTPVLGFNLGGLGFLSGVEEKDFSSALEKLAKNKFHVQERKMLSVVKNKEKKIGLSLNEIMVRHEMSGHAVVLDVAADGLDIIRYLADGLVISTPTGSTAYSLSAGGPILLHDADVVVVTPVCPHALGARSIVTRETVEFSVTLRKRKDGRSDPVGVYADGEKVFTLDADETAKICCANKTAKLVELDGYNPYKVLSKKLGWRGMPAL